MNITIVGAGAIGSLWAYHLANAGHKVSVWQKTTLASRYKLILNDKPAIGFRSNHTADLHKADLLIVTVKAWQVEAAISPILKHLSPTSTILFMHNGMGATDALADRIDHHPVILATTTHGAYKPSPSKVEHTGFGNTVIGGYNPAGSRCQFLYEVLNHALPTVSWDHSINTALWSKLAVNCVINPLTALHQCHNGALANPEYSDVIVRIISEVYEVMQAEHIDISEAKLLQTVHRVISATASNYSSMQQDIAYQRPTEIDFINGYLIRRAKQHGISVTTNIELYNKIKQIEQI